MNSYDSTAEARRPKPSAHTVFGDETVMVFYSGEDEPRLLECATASDWASLHYRCSPGYPCAADEPYQSWVKIDGCWVESGWNPPPRASAAGREVDE